MVAKSNSAQKTIDESKSFFSFKTRDNNSITKILAKNRTVEFKQINQMQDKLTIGSLVFLVLGGDKVGWSKGLTGIGLISKEPYDLGYDPSNLKNFKIKVSIEILFTKQIIREELIPYRDTYGLISIGPSLKGEPNQALSRVDKSQAISLLRAILDLRPEVADNLKTFAGENVYSKMIGPATILTPLAVAYGQKVSASVLPSTSMKEERLKSKRRYWLYTPGEQAKYWEKFYTENIMGIGWNEVGDLLAFKSKTDIRNKLSVARGTDSTHKHSGLALWQFANEISVGDIIFVKKGSQQIIGKGIVDSDYKYDETNAEYFHTRKVKWESKGEWVSPENLTIKTLTDITLYTESVEKLLELFDEEELEYEPNDVISEKLELYTQEDFLQEVFIDEKQYSTLKELLLHKKNIILQGAPGVGKTFIAQRLAYAIMGVKDSSRIETVQFHQSYGYEDLMMGFRPSENGFKQSYGVFYTFCKKALEDDENPYFFIIDEINRGNISKIFGDLLMLIEHDKRDEGHSLRLIYSDEQFYVPPNVHIIGMMNTADRSLAVIDYALRRRFAFYNVKPAFSSSQFEEFLVKSQSKELVNLITSVKQLNIAIEEDLLLGNGFCIGHSYFCQSKRYDTNSLSMIVEYELIPLLEEYWFDEPEKVSEWTEKLRMAISA